MLKGISFQVLRAEYENPFFAYSRLYFGLLRLQLLSSARPCVSANQNQTDTAVLSRGFTTFLHFGAIHYTFY